MKLELEFTQPEKQIYYIECSEVEDLNGLKNILIDFLNSNNYLSVSAAAVEEYFLRIGNQKIFGRPIHVCFQGYPSAPMSCSIKELNEKEGESLTIIAPWCGIVHVFVINISSR
jgi:hypothetical protein